jgi:catechol 2,3-dioxygenase-like lactoylglutathione lyase family enzyme
MAERVLGMHHIGITVPDIKEAIAFFKTVFGAIEVFHTGAFDVDNNFMRKTWCCPHQPHSRSRVFALWQWHQC